LLSGAHVADWSGIAKSVRTAAEDPALALRTRPDGEPVGEISVMRYAGIVSEPEPPLACQESAPLDHYQEQCMGGDAAVVLHVKTRSNWQAPALAGAAALFVIVWCAMHINLGLGLGLSLGGFIMLLGLFFGVLRVKITPEHVDIHYGMIGPKIPLTAIERIEPVQHDYSSFLRWGISPIGRGEWLYAVAGDQGRAVKIVWRSPSGKRRVHYIGSPDHEALASAITGARARVSLSNGTRALSAEPGED
jgi:hypothetical protein